MLYKKRVFAAKVETTPGTAESLTATEGVFNAYVPVTQPDIPFEEREGQGAFSPLSGVPNARSGTVNFEVDMLLGSGALPTWASVLLPACGFVEDTGVFAPVTESPGTNVKTLTIGTYEDGMFKRIKGAVGNPVFTFTSGMNVRVAFSFTGIWVPPTDVAIIAPTYPTTAPLRFAGATALTLGAATPKIQQMTLDFGNTITLREDATDISGYSTAIITGRRITGSINPESVLVATKDYYGEWIARTEQALALTLSQGGLSVAFAAPKLQWTNVQGGDRNGMAIEDLSFVLNRSAAAGDDELTITFDTTA